MTQTLLNNRYRILQPLGKGGFSHTYLAVDSYTPSEKKCVIKQLSPIMQQPLEWLQERFAKEAATLEQLGDGHPQIPKLYAYFAEEDDFYLVQEYVEGVTLTQKQQQAGCLSEGEVSQILVGILPVLEYVHSQRIIHRDIKPDNIILRKRDDSPVLIDFGAVREALATAINSQGHVTSSVVIGTPGYMSSEQAAGRPLYSSDLYSLGLTAIFLLTGKTPQQLESDPATGEWLWRKEVPSLHSNLAGVLDKAIRYHPRDRFSSATEMLQALKSKSEVRSTVATVVASPGSSYHRNRPEQTALGTVAVSPTPRSSQGNQRKGVLALMLFILAVIAGAIAYSVFNADSEIESPVVSTPQPTLEPSMSPSPSPTVSPIPKPIPSPSPTPTPSPVIPSPSPIPSPTPTPFPVIPSPSPIETPRESFSVPIFTIGTSRQRIEAELGQPTSSRKGYWENTRSVIYDDVLPNRATLGYIFDADNGKLRQTEVSFYPSVDLEVMQRTLEGLLEGNVPPAARQGLEKVYNRETDLRSFSINGYRGIIQRNERDRVYIGVWEASLH